MGTSRSGSVGSTTRWKVTRDDVKAIADALLAGVAISIPQTKLSDGGKAGGLGAAGSIPQSGTGTPMVPRSIRALGKRLVESANADDRFVLQMGDCAVKVAIEVLLELFNAAKMKYRIQRDTDRLLAEYGISGTKRVAVGLAKALDQRYRENVIKKCKKATKTEEARMAMHDTLIDILSPDGTPGAFVKLSADEIHAALRRSNSMKIVERFYANYLNKTLEFIVSSLQADISPKAEKNVLKALDVTYSDYAGRQIVKRAQEKGWRAGEIPDKADEWLDLLVAEEAHA